MINYPFVGPMHLQEWGQQVSWSRDDLSWDEKNRQVKLLFKT